MYEKITVLLSVYAKEDPNYLDEALQSIEVQTFLPNEIVLVKDGPLTVELDRIVSLHVQKSNVAYKVVELKNNVGLGKALNEGLKYCTSEWIARMDSDDIALPNRFEKQFTYFSEYPETDILGSWMCEFDSDPDICDNERRVPALHNDIVRFAKYRNPMNHMTVIFKKSAVDDVGGYKAMNGFEDYYLWMRMLRSGKKFANLPEVTLKARVGNGMVSRRQGWQYAKDELSLQKAAYKIGFWSKMDLAQNFFVRFLPRLLPVFIVEKLYNLLRKN